MGMPCGADRCPLVKLLSPFLGRLGFIADILRLTSLESKSAVQHILVPTPFGSLRQLTTLDGQDSLEAAISNSKT